MNEPETLAEQNGFSHWAQLNTAAAVPLEAVRDMCADGRQLHTLRPLHVP